MKIIKIVFLFLVLFIVINIFLATIVVNITSKRNEEITYNGEALTISFLTYRELEVWERRPYTIELNYTRIKLIEYLSDGITGCKMYKAIVISGPYNGKVVWVIDKYFVKSE